MKITAMLALATLTLLVASPIMGSGVPSTITIQGRLTDAANVIVVDGVYAITFKIYSDSTGGTALWFETQPVQVTGGLFVAQLGHSTALPADLFASGAEYYLGITVNLEPELPRLPLTSVAYSYQAKDADVAAVALDLTCAGCVSAGEIAADAVGAAEIADGSVGIAEIGTAAVGSDEIATNAVGAAEIATGAVGATEVLDGSLSADDIASGAVGTSEVLNGSLTAVDIADEPGVGSDNDNIVFLYNESEVYFLAGRTMTAPVDGYVLVIATASVELQHTNGDLTSFKFGLSDNITDFGWSNSAVSEVGFPSALPSGTYSFPVVAHALIPITAGSQAYYALGEKLGNNTAFVWAVQLTECFFPTAYTTVSTPVPPTGSDAESAVPFDPEAERLEAQSFHNARMQAELDKMKAELEAVKQEMSDLKNSDESER